LRPEIEIPRQLGCVAGREETLEFVQTRQTQVTLAREAASGGDNRAYRS